MSPQDFHAYCAEKALASGSSFYYSFRFLPPEKRQAITAVYAFCREVDDAVDESSNAQLAEQKLAFWRKEISLVYQGVASHPVGKALQAVVAEHHIAEAELATIIDGMAQDLWQKRYAHEDDLNAYCYKVAGVVGVVSAKIFGYTHADTLRYAVQLGEALQWINIIRDVGEDARRDRVYLPQSLMNEFGVDKELLLRGQAQTSLTPLLVKMSAQALAKMEAALRTLPPVDRKAQRPGLMMAEIYRQTLLQIQLQNYPSLTERVRLSPLRKLFIAWRVWVRN